MASCVNNSDLILFSLVALTFRGSWLCVCLHLNTLKPSSTAAKLLHWLSYVENVKVWSRRLTSVISAVSENRVACQLTRVVQSLLDNRMACCLNNSASNTWFCVFSSPCSFDLSYKLAMCVLICLNPQTLCRFERSYFTIKTCQGYCCSRSFRVNSVSLFSSFNHEKTIFCRVRSRTKKKMTSNKFYKSTDHNFFGCLLQA